MKSYYEDHELAYQQIKRNGFVGWGNKKDLKELEDPDIKTFLDHTIQEFFTTPKGRSALDLGCGTGTSAFMLAKLGFAVTGFDISQTAIDMAAELSEQQNLNIKFKVHDILDLPSYGQKFDLIYDSHCLHCIVFEEDRARVFAGVKTSLKPEGFFVLDTMIHTDDVDITKPYDTLRFDENYILWHKTKPRTDRGVVELNGQHWCARRRVYPKETVIREILQAGLKVVSQKVGRSSDDVPYTLKVVVST